jgi:hypothetical protein
MGHSEQGVHGAWTAATRAGSRALAICLLLAGCSDPCEPLDCVDPSSCWAFAEGPDGGAAGPHFVARLTFPALERLGADRVRDEQKPATSSVAVGDRTLLLRTSVGPLSLRRQDEQLVAQVPLVYEVGHLADPNTPAPLAIEERVGGVLSWPVVFEIHRGALRIAAVDQPTVRTPEQWALPPAEHAAADGLARRAGNAWSGRLARIDLLKLAPTPALRGATWAVHTGERTVALAATPPQPVPGPPLDPLGRDLRPGVRQDLTQTASWGLLQAAGRAGPAIDGVATQPLLLARDQVPRVVLRARASEGCGLADAEVMLAAGKPSHALPLTPSGPPRLLRAVGAFESFDPRWVEPALQRLGAAVADPVVRGFGPERFAPVLNRPVPGGLARDYRVPRRLPFKAPATLSPSGRPATGRPPPGTPPARRTPPPPAPPASGR